MCYTVVLKDDKNNTVELDCVENLQEGTQFDVNSMFQAELNVSYNLCKFFKEVFGEEGLYYLYNKKAESVKTDLYNGYLLLGTNFNGDPWSEDANNAGYYLEKLYKWACEKPNCTFFVY